MPHRVVRCSCGQEMRVPVATLNRYGKCVACERRLKITEVNSRVEGLEEPAAVSQAPATACARCGRAFHGDWDRIETASGVMCNLCGRHADVAAPPRALHEMAAPEETVAPLSLASFSTIRPEKPKKPKPTWKEAAVFAAVAAVMFGVIVFLPVEEYAAEFFAPKEDALEKGLAPWQVATFRVTEIVLGVLGMGIFVYLGLAISNRLPSEHLDENLKAVGVAAALLYVVSLAPVPLLPFIVQVALLVWLFGLDLFHVPAFIVAGLLGNLIAMVLTAFAYGMLAGMFL